VRERWKDLKWSEKEPEIKDLQAIEVNYF